MPQTKNQPSKSVIELKADIKSARGNQDKEEQAFKKYRAAHPPRILKRKQIRNKRRRQ